MAVWSQQRHPALTGWQGHAGSELPRPDVFVLPRVVYTAAVFSETVVGCDLTRLPVN